MKISYNWLQSHIELKESPEEVAEKLTQAGLEVEHIEEVFLYKGKKLHNPLDGLVIGEVLTCEKHPNADKLSKTTVDIGGKIVPIVCGASNVAQGQKVVVATVGATLFPTEQEPFSIKKAKIRGEESEGMICAEDEIGLGNSHEGIIVLETQLSNGTAAKEYFGIEKDYVIEIGLTPNRVDAASHLGVARDLSVLLQKTRKSIELLPKDFFKEKCPIHIDVQDTQACLRYAGLWIGKIMVKDSPNWLKNRLKAIGLHPINNIVDATNYVLHHLGQPLHAFDASKITNQKIIVKKLSQETKFTTLDGVEHNLSPKDLMICDDISPLAIAGVFGGLNSGIGSDTTSIFIESAYFQPDSIRKTAQLQGLKTDASFRFERGTDPNMPVVALQMIAKLLGEIADASDFSEIIDFYPNKIENFRINVSYKNITRLIGKELDKNFIKSTLKGLEIDILEEKEDNLWLSVPPYRVDVQREADIIEEILRIYGFNNIEVKDSLNASFLASFPKIDKFQLQNQLTALLADNGFNEIITNSLTKPLYADTLKHINTNENVVILNKLSEELEVLRQSLVFSGLEVIAYNLNRKQKDLKIFEFGKTYKKIADMGNVTEKYKESNTLAIFLTGNKQAETWQENSQKSDFHTLANIVDKVLRKLGVRQFDKVPVEAHTLAYGLAYQREKYVFATLGELQSYILKTADLKQNVFYAELDWDYLVACYHNEHTYQEIPKFPEVKRDLSLVLDKHISYQEIEKQAFILEKKLLKKMNIFSVFEGEQLGKGKKSYAISFFLQDENQTLTDNQIDKVMQKLIEGFRNSFGAIIRD
ncbi:MAG: phenylalanine--tRNA ligase subunit beta [Cytophagales bacterium]|nr:phenylalanine--tRNA ligase subunit beta [Cytophagales bacterium]